jgi:hypothetical protein
MIVSDLACTYPSIDRPERGELAGLRPLVIGATGGSGTRVVARIVRHAGLFIGHDLLISEDPPAFGEFSDRWINLFMSFAGTHLPQGIERAMATELAELVRQHLAPLMPPVEGWLAAHPALTWLRSRWPGLTHSGSRRWGWKEPRSIFLLPFLHAQFPRMQFLHVVRDGRDMAYSGNQNQLNKHGHCLLGPDEDSLARPIRTALLWTRINLMAADYGERVLRNAYLRIRYEDLCADSRPSIDRILRFVGGGGNPDLLAEEVRPPASLGRWRSEDEATVAELTRLTAPARLRFGWTP